MATTDLLNKQLLNTMNVLNIPQNLQNTILNLSSQQKQSMLALYSRQTDKHTKPKSPSNHPLDTQLLNRMNELSVPKHIQSQILTLPTQDKRILLDKYNISHNTHIINQSHTSLIYESELDVLDEELLYLMKQNNMRLISLNKLKSFPKWEKKQYIDTLKQKIKYKKHTHTHAYTLTPEEKYDIMNSNDINIKQCLRCLQSINVDNIDSKCKFHALSSQAPQYDNIEYFMQRNDDLGHVKNFKFSCCERKCKGYFLNFKSQQNGCCILEKHLFDNKQNTNNTNINNKFNLCGKWKMFAYFENKKTIQRIQDIEIIKHNKFGEIEGHLTRTTYIGGDKYDYNHNFATDHDDDLCDLYSGQLRGEQLILTYRGKHSYVESYVLNVEEYQLSGQFASDHTRGKCQWFKVQKIT